MNEKISIVVPVYNCEKYIEKCIKSIINQTYSNLEIIIVNDGSTDSTKEKCEKLCALDSRIKLISTNNLGVSNARNIGIENSSGDYITFVDSDDFIDNTAYEECIKFITKYDLDILRFSYIKEYGKIKKERKFKSKTNVEISKSDYQEQIYINAFDSEDFTSIWNAIIKKEILNQIKFDINIKFAEDFLFMMEAINKSKNLYLFNKPFYHYIMNIHSATQDYEYDKIISRLDNIFVANTRVLKEIIPDNNVLEKYKNKIKSAIDEKIGIIASNSSYSHFKNAVDEIKKLESYKEVCYFSKYDKMNKSYIKYLMCRYRIKMKRIIKKILSKGE